jgi:integrase
VKRQKLTKRTVDAAPPPTTGESRVWDDELTGYCLRVYSSGRKVYALKYRVAGRQRWLTIGEHGNPWTPDAARAAAKTALLEAGQGHDPATKTRRRDDLTVLKLIALYLEEGPRSKPDKRSGSWTSDRSNLERHVKPTIGRRLVSGLSKNDITRMNAAITSGETATVEKTKARGRAVVTGGAGIAARCHSTARAMFAWAIEEGYSAAPNPCAGVKLAARPSAERFMSEKQAADLMTALTELEAEKAISPGQAAIFRLLLFTGARRAEIAGLRWSEVDFDRQRLVLPPARTKAGGKSGERRITLNTAAVAILKELEKNRTTDKFVFPATKGGSGHTTSEGKVWREKVLPRARLAGVRIHDLRHSFASFALADGASLALIGKALGHASSRATERYAQLSDDPLRALSERMGERFGAPKTP